MKEIRIYIMRLLVGYAERLSTTFVMTSFRYRLQDNCTQGEELRK